MQDQRLSHTVGRGRQSGKTGGDEGSVTFDAVLIESNLGCLGILSFLLL